MNPQTQAPQAGGPPAVAGLPPIRLGLCGAAGGGKTTFLGALSIAVTTANGRTGRWAIAPADVPSRDFLVAKEQELINGRKFPVPTNVTTAYQWQIDGQPTTNGHRRGLLRRSSLPAEVSFTLEVEDRPGGAFLMDNTAPMPPDSLERLVSASGLIFLFDPMRELNRGAATQQANQGGGLLSNWLYFHKLVQTLRMIALQRGILVKGLLPHYLAVCITKFDDPHVFLPAYYNRMIDIGEDGVPRVPASRGKEFFDWLCTQLEQRSPDFSASQLAELIAASFDERKIAYYTTSSIGFKTAAGGQLDPGDFQNYDVVNGQLVIGRVRPVNVLEPLVDIERRVRAEGSR